MENLEIKTLKVLNDLTQKDNASMVALLSFLHPTNNKVLEDYDVRVEKKGYQTMGILTILNKTIEETGKKIVPKYKAESFSGGFELLGFELEDR